jgi:predicted nucleic acid-binding protein
MARSLVDTNILVYSRDLNEPVKRARAIEVIDQLGAGGELVLSAQCLNEFSSTSLRRGTPIAEVRAAVSVWHDLGDVLSLTGSATTAALVRSSTRPDAHSQRPCCRSRWKPTITGDVAPTHAG